jgi:hypothetical protein
MHEIWQFLKFYMDFNHLRVALIIYYKHLHLDIHFNLGATQLFFDTSFLFCWSFNVLTQVPIIINNNIDVW